MKNSIAIIYISILGNFVDTESNTGVVVIIDVYFYHRDRINDYNINCVLIIGGLEYNDDPGGCQEDFREPNGVVNLKIQRLH